MPNPFPNPNPNPNLAVRAMNAGSLDPMSLSIARFTAPEVVSGPGEG